ncbi:hypothetical protein QM403_11465 [Auritidibacter ignavus]|nr:hypothetical protein [Auritidibacter ignavus]WHS34899.1 hypothetical protein QM403_11465 [Auritidibacter ignavus]
MISAREERHPSVFIKVCGVTRAEHVEWAAELGYDAVGFMCVRNSPRYVPVEQLADLARVARNRIRTMAVGMTFTEVEQALDLVDAVQLYEYDPRPAHLAVASAEAPTRADAHPNVEYWFYDISHGTGSFTAPPDWMHEARIPVVLAGGLHPENVAEVVRNYHPAGLDVSSGVEKERGVKDRHLMEAFIRRARQAQTTPSSEA